MAKRWRIFLTATLVPSLALAAVDEALLEEFQSGSAWHDSDVRTTIQEGIEGRDGTIAELAEVFTLDRSTAGSLLDAAVLTWLAEAAYEAGAGDPAEAEAAIRAALGAAKGASEEILLEVMTFLDTLAVHEAQAATALAQLLESAPDERSWIQAIEDESYFWSRSATVGVLLHRDPSHPILLAELAEGLPLVERAALLGEAIAGLETRGQPPSSELTLYLHRARIKALLKVGLFDEAIRGFAATQAKADAAGLEAAGGDLETRLGGWRLERSGADTESLSELLASAFVLAGDPRRADATLEQAGKTEGEPGASPSVEHALASWFLAHPVERGDAWPILERALGLTEFTRWGDSVSTLLLAADLARTEGYPAIERRLLERALVVLRVATRDAVDPSQLPSRRAVAEASRLHAATERLEADLLARIAIERGDLDERTPASAFTFEVLGPSLGWAGDDWDPDPELASSDHPLPRGYHPVNRLQGLGRIGYIANGPSHLRGRSNRGYWLFESTDGGLSWSLPIYLGLVVNEVFRIHAATGQLSRTELAVEATRLSLDSGEGFRTSTLERGILEIDLRPARADSDRDGLSDMVESLLGTDPDNEDSDGDGLGDATDRMPQLRGEGEADGSAASGAFRRGVTEVFGPYLTRDHRRRPLPANGVRTVILAVDEAPVHTLTPGPRLVVVRRSPAAVLGLTAEAARQASPTIEIPLFAVDHDGGRALLEWRAGGGSYGSVTLKRELNGWQPVTSLHAGSCFNIIIEHETAEATEAGE